MAIVGWYAPTLIPVGHNYGLRGFLPAYLVVTTMAII
jgi:hypothetical protein